jgi:hypothetical protein
MLRTIDGKSLLIGGLLVAVAVCAMATTAAPWMNGEHNGRFTMIVYPVPDGGNNVAIVGGVGRGGNGAITRDGGILYPLPSLYILDTATGQVWTPSYPNIETFYAPKLEALAPGEEPVDPNQPQP